MSLSDVVQQGSGHDVAVVDTPGDDGQGGVVSVTLIGDLLGEEHGGGLGGQPVRDRSLLGRVQRV